MDTIHSQFGHGGTIPGLPAHGLVLVAVQDVAGLCTTGRTADEPELPVALAVARRAVAEPAMRTWYWFMSVIRTRRLVPPGSPLGTDLVLAGVALVALRAVALFISIAYSDPRTYGGS